VRRQPTRLLVTALTSGNAPGVRQIAAIHDRAVASTFAGTTALITGGTKAIDTRRLCCSGMPGPSHRHREPAGRDRLRVDLSRWVITLQITDADCGCVGESLPARRAVQQRGANSWVDESKPTGLPRRSREPDRSVSIASAYRA